MNGQPSRITADKPCLPPHEEKCTRNLLTEVLPRVSRSFYLTLRALPESIRPQIGLAYLLARAADTIADTRIVPREKRLAKLLLFRKQLDRNGSADEIREIQEDVTPVQSLPAEKELLEKIGPCFTLLTSFGAEDQRLIVEVVTTLTRGMEFDLTRFPGESGDQLEALDNAEDLDQYTYFVAGCVGPFWTKMCMAHLKVVNGWNAGTMEEWGIRFGKGLQLCNILRDIPKDLRIGRCYLPSAELQEFGLKPVDLLNPSAQERLRPLYAKYLDRALSHLEAGWRYTLSVPPSLPRLRLACAWPILIGLKTLARLRNHPDILDPDRRIKISRGEVYGILARTFFIQRSDERLNRYYQKLVWQATG